MITHTIKYLFVFIAAFYCNFSTMAFAQTVSLPVSDGHTSFTVSELAQRGNNLHLKMTIHLDAGSGVASNQSIDYLPVLIASDRNKVLPVVSLKGRANYKYYKRRVDLMSRSQYDQFMKSDDAYYKVIKAYKPTAGDVDYDVNIPYESWMNNARLELMKNDCGCGKSVPAGNRLLCDNVDYERPSVQLVAQEQPQQPVKQQPEVAQNSESSRLVTITDNDTPMANSNNGIDCSLNFRNNSSLIIPDYKDNKRILAGLSKLARQARANRTPLVIIGYASPDGPIATNRRLARERALVLTTYLEQRCGMPKGQCFVTFGGEDWKGLVARIRTSRLKQKKDVLDIISRYAHPEVRKRQMKAYEGGQPYSYIVKTMCPPLRRTVIKTTKKSYK
jgi:outer membrane protein OmpA-like peptidoglycan-associated protein